MGYRRRFGACKKAMRPPSISRCSCKGSCLKKVCGCQKQGTTCTDFCKCGKKCKNKEQPGSTTKEDDSISTTLNSTYNLEEKENISLQNNSANDFVEPEKPKAKKRTSQNDNTDKVKHKTKKTNDSDISSSMEEGMKKKRRLLNGSSSFFKPLA